MNKKLRNALIICSVVFLGLFLFVSRPQATNKLVWGEPVYSEWGNCLQQGYQCGETQGQQSRLVTRTCKWGHAQSHECTIEYTACPQGYFVSILDNTECRKASWPFNTIDRPNTPEVELTWEYQSCELAEQDVIACEPECEEGYHLAEVGQGELYETPQCVPDEPEVPGEPVPAQTFTHPSTTTAFQCPNGDVNELPKNIHVVRSGSTATMQWFWVLGDSANIYYKVNGESTWTHSVRDIPRSGDFASVEISGLNPNLGYTFAVQPKVGCGGGVLGVVIDPPSEGETFGFSYWEVI